MKPWLLDLFCGAGGAAVGYARAGFEVVGVDIRPQPNYPFDFHQTDALTYPLDGFDAIHASPPCQAFTNAQRIRGRAHVQYVTAIRERLQHQLYVIENVPGAPLRQPIDLCGAMFGLRTYRHRLFETNWLLVPPKHPPHVAATTKMGRPPKADEFMHIVGNFSNVKAARAAMGIDWMTRDELRESIPPVYTEYIGHQLMAQLAFRALTSERFGTKIGITRTTEDE